MKEKYLICKHCGNIVTMVKDSNVPIVCCGEKMSVINPGTVDASKEKHIPIFEVNNNEVIVKIGSQDHPMVDVHYIEWVSIHTNKGFQIKYLNPNMAPTVSFSLTNDDKLIAVYAYCNLHGLWVNRNE